MRRLSPRRQTSSRIVDAHRHGNRFVVREGEKRTLFLELEATVSRYASSKSPLYSSVSITLPLAS